MLSWCRSLTSVTLDSDSKLHRTEENAFTESGFMTIIVPSSIEVVDMTYWSNSESSAFIAIVSWSNPERIRTLTFTQVAWQPLLVVFCWNTVLNMFCWCKVIVVWCIWVEFDTVQLKEPDLPSGWIGRKTFFLFLNVSANTNQDWQLYRFTSTLRPRAPLPICWLPLSQ